MLVTGDEGFVRTPDGFDLHWRGSAPPLPRAVLVLVQGLAEHTGRYAHVLTFCAEQAFAAYAFDLRGQGRSAGLAGHVDSFDDYLLDLGAVREHAARRHPGVPLFLVGHSMGGLVALRYAQAGADGLRGLVLSSPLLGIAKASRPSPGRAALGRLASSFFPRLRLATHVDPAHLSRDPSVGEAYARDPLVGRKVSARWFKSAAKAMADAHSAARALPLPTLVMAAGEDLLADTEATARFVAGAPRDRVDFQVWDGLYHELFNAPEKGAVLGRMRAWIEARLAP